ncbi:hypothetical protein AC579_2562 [Pseudocercospora musae]|uniref:Uncharacterized protein n=1 Tax=Pseudocercospora musae TaxID=113226 RepID=A0A139I261_9PEZI|nr:hypothetical protein AC579_2562 [Pseudocercospora musae]
MAYSSDDTPTVNASGSSIGHDQKADEGVTEYLLKLSTELMLARPIRLWSSRESGTAMTHNERLEANRKVFSTYSQHNIKIVDMKASLDRGMKRGTGFINIAVSGAPPETTREGIA